MPRKLTPQEIADARLIADAHIYAQAAHDAVGQVRKYTGEPYSVHPQAVAAIVAGEGFPAIVVAAAHLHDVIEDTKISRDALARAFPREVVDLVEMVTDVSRPEDGNRAARKALDLAHLIRATPYGRAIKVADLIDNTRSIVAHDPHFSRVYLPEKRAVLRAIGDTTGCAEIVAAWREVFGEEMRPF